MSSQTLPIDIFNHLISFRPIHPVAKLIRDLKSKFSYCVVCYEKERVSDGKGDGKKMLECCSSTCYRQLCDANYYEYGFPGSQFECIMNV